MDRQAADRIDPLTELVNQPPLDQALASALESAVMVAVHSHAESAAALAGSPDSTHVLATAVRLLGKLPAPVLRQIGLGIQSWDQASSRAKVCILVTSDSGGRRGMSCSPSI